MLSNIVLHALDSELERRGHRFVRYADDCNVYVRSERAGQRVMASLTRFITLRLKLKVNMAKSAVAPARVLSFLGFSFTAGSAAEAACGRLDAGPVPEASSDADPTGPRSQRPPNGARAGHLPARLAGVLWLLPDAHDSPTS